MAARRPAKSSQPGAVPPPEDLGLAHRVERALRARILAGELAPGTRLRQDHIAREFAASPIPVREALRRLEGIGLVECRPRRGAVVAGVSAADALEVAEMRAALECLALEAAIPRLTRADLAVARAAIAASDASDDAAAWLAENRRFHLALYAPCARPRLIAAIEELWLAGDRHLMTVWSRLDYQARSQDEHRALLADCAARRRGAAVRRLKAHILDAGRALAGLLESRGAG